MHISFWCLKVVSLYLPNANGPSAEALLSFSDSVMLLVLPIAAGILLYIFRIILSIAAFRKFTEHNLLEFTWTFLPAVSLILLALPSLSLLYLLDEVGSPTSTTKIQGHQWFWRYEASDAAYYGYDSYLCSGPLRLLNADTSLTVCSRLTLRLLVTGADVLHSWTVPAWGVKADAVPGRLNMLSTNLDRPGIFYGQCSEICGSNHSFIPILATVLLSS